MPKFDGEDRSEIKRNVYEIIGLSQQLTYDMEIEEHYDDVAILQRVAKCCFNVLGRMINFDALERLDNPELMKINLGHLVEDMVSVCRSKLRRLDVKITCECDNGVWVYVSVECLVDCLMNLVINSVQNIGSDGGDVKIKVSRLSESAAISVSDNGYGMDKGRLDEYLNSETYKGGLAVVKKFCDSMNTKMIIDTGIGDGFMISFRIPLADDGSIELRSTCSILPTGTFSAMNIYLSKIENAIIDIMP